MIKLKNKLSNAFYIVLCVGFLVGCTGHKHTEKCKQTKKVVNDTLKTNEENSTGIGITTSGKVGIEVVDGIYMDIDGNIGFGVGF